MLDTNIDKKTFTTPCSVKNLALEAAKLLLCSWTGMHALSFWYL